MCPFPIVWGIPNGTPEGDLLELRRNIVAVLKEKMGIPARYIHPLFPTDNVWIAPQGEVDGSDVILVRLGHRDVPWGVGRVRAGIGTSLAEGKRCPFGFGNGGVRSPW